MYARKDREEADRRAREVILRKRAKQMQKYRDDAEAKRKAIAVDSPLQSLIQQGDHKAAYALACERVSSLARMLGLSTTQQNSKGDESWTT